MIDKWRSNRGLGYAAGLVGGSILIAPYVQPAWLMSLVVILFALILWRFFDTKYLTYSICVIAVLYGITLLPLFCILLHACHACSGRTGLPAWC